MIVLRGASLPPAASGWLAADVVTGQTITVLVDQHPYRLSVKEATRISEQLVYQRNLAAARARSALTQAIRLAEAGDQAERITLDDSQEVEVLEALDTIERDKPLTSELRWLQIRLRGKGRKHPSE